jgi:hypothetical protein
MKVSMKVESSALTMAVMLNDMKVDKSVAMTVVKTVLQLAWTMVVLMALPWD